MPTGAVSLLTTGLLSFAAKRRAARLLARLGRIDTGALAGVSMAAWLERRGRRARSARLARRRRARLDLLRRSERLSAGAAIAQLASVAAHGVRYLDGGWQSLVDGLAAVAQRGACYRRGRTRT